MWEVREDGFLATLRGYVRRSACKFYKGRQSELGHLSKRRIRFRLNFLGGKCDSLGDHQGQSSNKKSSRFICWPQHMNRLQ
jgi:hypothetical protein